MLESTIKPGTEILFCFDNDNRVFTGTTLGSSLFEGEKMYFMHAIRPDYNPLGTVGLNENNIALNMDELGKKQCRPLTFVGSIKIERPKYDIKITGADEAILQINRFQERMQGMKFFDDSKLHGENYL